jgi:hypothetical protein
MTERSINLPAHKTRKEERTLDTTHLSTDVPLADALGGSKSHYDLAMLSSLVAKSTLKDNRNQSKHSVYKDCHR